MEEFSVFEDWLDRYNYLIELGGDLPAIEPEYRTNEYLINGCQSKVWLHAELVDGRLQYKADSDAIIVKGIVALLVSGETDLPSGTKGSMIRPVVSHTTHKFLTSAFFSFKCA